LSLCAALLAGCDGAPEELDGGTPPGDAATPNPFEAQVARGGALFGANCARCHGADGSGTAIAPRLVGLAEGALPLDPPASRMVRTAQFVTVGDVAAFASVNMPADAPGSLTTDEYYAILAFDLSANGIDLETELTAEIAAGLTIPR